MRDLLRGALAGAVATAAMSVPMVASERCGGMPGQPPRRIVDHLAPALDDPAAHRAAVVVHLAIGVVAGAVLAGLPGPRGPAPRLGVAYALAVWALGYEGWIPALGALPPAHRDRGGRVATMLTAHVVFGLVLGGLARR
ncbi:DUF6789 family protein [uncultured Amnibacterium sp.]|uniref:DUF6789 family protein n=1 Tax=uncultured Amnibacterium sp. TaxID=1631851 RepID=UPI0035CB5227